MSIEQTGASSASQGNVSAVEKLAALARITVEPSGAAAFDAEFSSVLKYISQLDELTLPTTGTPVVPAHHNIFRADSNPHTPGTWTEKVVALFPFKRGNSLTVKKIVSND
jgi:Asp-tRNA(Asn)/Glu-tRNA(Gln) amidotransferase C subunit